MNPTTAPTLEELTKIGIDRIIKMAGIFANDPTLDKWKDIYEPAKELIKEAKLTPEEYQEAIEQLTKAIKL